MNSDEISLKIDDLDREIIRRKEELDMVQVKKHNLEKDLLDLGESIRKEKFLLAKKRLEKEILTRDYWRAKG